MPLWEYIVSRTIHDVDTLSGGVESTTALTPPDAKNIAQGWRSHHPWSVEDFIEIRLDGELLERWVGAMDGPGGTPIWRVEREWDGHLEEELIFEDLDASI